MSDQNEVAKKVIELAAGQVGVAPNELTRNTHFINDLNYDSLDAVEFAMSIEDAFDIRFPDDKVEAVQTVGQAIDFVLVQLESSQQATT